MIKINRKDLIAMLDSVVPGLADGEENLEQSSCFVFHKGRVYTYNEEILCHAPCSMDIEGAIPSYPFLDLLKKMNEDEVSLIPKDESLKIVGLNKKSGIRYERDIKLPLDQVEEAKKWQDVPASFLDALDLVRGSCSTGDVKPVLQCVHITSEFVEAFDNTQAARAMVALPIKEDICLRYETVSYLVGTKVSQFAVTPNWVHFKEKSGMVICCRRYIDKYMDISSVFSDKGSTPINIPKGLAEAADKAGIFTMSDDSAVASRDMVHIKLSNGRLEVTGRGEVGYYTETKKAKYDGPAMEFAVQPATLVRIAEEESKAKVSAKKLVITGDKWMMIFCLYPTPTKEEVKKSQKTDEE